MAKAIQLDIPARDRQAELQKRLAEAPAEHAEAILEFLDLLEVLHQQNVLATIRGAIGAGDSLVTSVSKAMAQPESVRAIRNLIALSRILGRIDPELLRVIETSMANLPGNGQPDGRPRTPGLLQIAKVWWSPSVRRSLFAAGFLLAGVGLYLEKRRP